MLRAARQQGPAAAKRSWNVVVFSVGGMKVAARTEDVGGVSPWGERIPVPSRTPYVDSLVKRDKEVLPVYDLASQLHREVEGEEMLCLVARHLDGPMAICIDADVPTLQTLDVAEVKPMVSQDVDTLGSFESGGQDIAIVALQRLGKHT
jgi:chemotaxis signal transduction protein